MIRGVLQLAAAFVFLGCSDDTQGSKDTTSSESPDDLDVVCHADPITPVCQTPTITEKAIDEANHIPDETPILYEDVPPSAGDHRPAWARWGEYEMLPPQRWLHNLEHGGIVFLYDPCVPSTTVDALREYARARPNDETGQFRWVLTPYPGMARPIAVVAWEWTWLGDCVDAEAFDAFIDEHYRQATEDIAADGSYQKLWIGR